MPSTVHHDAPANRDCAREQRRRHRTPPQKDPSRPRQTFPGRTPNDATVPAESVRVTDRPASTATETDRAYVVERGLTKKDELDALIADYLAEADRLHAIPMSLSPFERYLEAIS